VLGARPGHEIADGEDGDGGAQRDHRNVGPKHAAINANITVVHDLGFLSNLPELAIGVPVSG
jgi:hypothetical protein